MDDLEKKYKTDKCDWLHGYTKKYNDLFKDVRLKKLKILEIGIGSVPMPSLRLWKDYFPNSQIYGIDIEETYIDNSVENITTFLCSSLNKQGIEEKLKPHGPFDIIIDDGIHRCDGQQLTFTNMFGLLADKGTYIIEDCGTSFKLDYHLNPRDINLVNLTYTIGPPNKRVKNDLPSWCITKNKLNGKFNTVNVFNNFKINKKFNSYFMENNTTPEHLKLLEEKIDDVEYWQGKTRNDSLIIVRSK
jgi:hypothetical protein